MTIHLPQNLLNTAPTLYEDFETVGDWTVPLGSIQADTTHYMTGSQGIELDQDVDGRCDIDKTVSWDFSSGDNFRLFIYTDTAWSAGSMTIILAADAGFAQYFSVTEVLSNGDRGKWHIYTFRKSDFSATGGMTWDDTVVLVRFRITTRAVFDYFTFGSDAVPACLIILDDSLEEHYDDVFPEFQLRHMLGTVACNTNLIDTAGYLTASELQEMGGAGWIMANHSIDAGMLTDDADHGDAALTEARTDLAGWGITADMGGEHVVYPNGAYNPAVLSVMSSLGMRTGRTTHALDDVLPNANLYTLGGRVVNAATSLATAQGYIDDAITKQAVVSLAFHQIVASSPTGNEWLLSDLILLLDYIVDQNIAHITLRDFYELSLGPINVREPGTKIDIRQNKTPIQVV